MREVASFRHEDHLRLVVFSPDGNTLASVTDKGTLRVFRAMPLKESEEALGKWPK
jgi:WD40 repeat protein